MFIIAFIRARQLSLSWASSIQSIPPHPTSWRSILMLPSHLSLGHPSGLFPSGVSYALLLLLLLLYCIIITLYLYYSLSRATVPTVYTHSVVWHNRSIHDRLSHRSYDYTLDDLPPSHFNIQVTQKVLKRSLMMAYNFRNMWQPLYGIKRNTRKDIELLMVRKFPTF
jgi:hypothetical protein